MFGTRSLNVTPVLLEQVRDVLTGFDTALSALLHCTVCMSFWKVFLYILYDTPLYRLFENFDSSSQFWLISKSNTPKNDPGFFFFSGIG